jgi:hypothetical protein
MRAPPEWIATAFGSTVFSGSRTSWAGISRRPPSGSPWSANRVVRLPAPTVVVPVISTGVFKSRVEPVT